MAGLERPGELWAAPLRGRADLRRELLGWEPDPLDALLAPAGAVAELVELDPPETIGGDFHQRAFRRAWLTLTTADGRGLVPGWRGQREVPPGTVAEVYFRKAGRIDGPTPQAGLERLFQQLLGPDVEQMYADLSRQIEATSDPGHRAFEPATLDPLLRPAFWRFYGFRQGARELDAQLAGLADLDGAELADVAQIVATVRDEAFRAGAVIGVALQARGLQQHLGEEVAAHRSAKKARREGAGTTNARKAQRWLPIEQSLYEIWRSRRADLERRKKTVEDVFAEVLFIFDKQQEALPPEVSLELPNMSSGDSRKMIKSWKDGHNPVEDGMGWRAFTAARRAARRAARKAVVR